MLNLYHQCLMVIVLKDNTRTDALPKKMKEDIILLRMLKSKILHSNNVLQQLWDKKDAVEDLKYVIQISSDSNHHMDAREYEEVLEIRCKEEEKLEIMNYDLEREIDGIIIKLPTRLLEIIQRNVPFKEPIKQYDESDFEAQHLCCNCNHSPMNCQVHE